MSQPRAVNPGEAVHEAMTPVTLPKMPPPVYVRQGHNVFMQQL
jgi:hypothetical protein